jgi:DNA repair protein RadC
VLTGCRTPADTLVRTPASSARNRAARHATVVGPGVALLACVLAPESDVPGRGPDVPPNGPRERIWRRGAIDVSDEELIAILVGTGIRDHPALAVAAELVRTAGGLAAMSRASPRELAQVCGVGEARAATIVAAFELGRRAMELAERARVVSPTDVFRLCAPRLAGLQQEVFLVIGIDIRNGLLDIVEAARGSLNGVEVHPREVFRPLVRMAAAAGVVVHNHPSGDPTPSEEDLSLTARLREAGDILGVPIIDHIVIGAQRHRSIGELLGDDELWPEPD